MADFFVLLMQIIYSVLDVILTETNMILMKRIRSTTTIRVHYVIRSKQQFIASIVRQSLCLVKEIVNNGGSMQKTMGGINAVRILVIFLWQLQPREL